MFVNRRVFLIVCLFGLSDIQPFFCRSGGDEDAADKETENDTEIPDMDVPDGPMKVEGGSLSIISVRAVAVTASSAILTWYTFEPADSQADFGPDDTYGTTTPLDNETVTAHRAVLTDLQPDTEYHYRVRSTDADGNQGVSADHVFRTLPDSCNTGTAFYVDAASSGGDGTSLETAWQSPEDIDWAEVGPGACVIFREGEYAASLRVSGSGETDNPITVYPAGPAVLTGDVLVEEGAHDVVIRGFELTGLEADPEARGPDIGMGGDGSAFIDNYLHHTNGLSLSGTNNTARNNLFYFTHGISIVAAGTDSTAENNDVSHTICGFWGDADTSRFFGERNTIRNNFFHDVLDEESPGCSPHCDCFQTYSVNEGEAAHDITIENNYCYNICGQMFMGEGILNENTHSDLMFRGNVFEKVGAIAINAGGIRNMTFDHNTFVDTGLGAIAVGDAPGIVVSNNLFYNNPYAYACEGGAANYNWIFPYDCHNEFVEPNGTYGKDPLLLGPAHHDFTPTPGSPACSAGKGESRVGALPCDSVTECFDPDSDGYGKPTSSFCAHSEEDCDNADPNAFPGNPEVCDDAADNDCNGLRNEDCADAAPILELHFDNGIEDSSPSGFSPVWEGSTGSFAEGETGEALSLSGGDSPYVVAADDPRLGNMGLLHISVWAKKNGATGGTVFLKHVCYTLNLGEDTIDAYIQTESGAVDLDVYGTSAVNDTNWHHYEMTYDIRTGKAALLVDGSELASGTGSGKVRWDPCDLRDIYIGKDPWGDAFDGVIDEFVIHDTVW